VTETVQQGAQSKNIKRAVALKLWLKENHIRDKNLVPDGALSILEKNHSRAAKTGGLAFHRW